jgi:hypothetical protein
MAGELSDRRPGGTSSKDRDASVAASFSAAELSFISVILGLRSHRRSDTEQRRTDIGIDHELSGTMDIVR